MPAATNFTASGVDFAIEADVNTLFDDDSYIKLKNALDLHTHAAGYGAAVARVAATSEITVTSSVANTGLSITNTDPGNAGVRLTMLHSSATPAAADNVTDLLMQGKDAGGNTTSYGLLRTSIIDTTDGSEDGRVALHAAIAGALTRALFVDSTGATVDTGNLIVTAGYLQLAEMTAPAGTTDKARIYAVVDGGSKTDLMAIFQSGAAQTIAQEP